MSGVIGGGGGDPPPFPASSSPSSLLSLSLSSLAALLSPSQLIQIEADLRDFKAHWEEEIERIELEIDVKCRMLEVCERGIVGRVYEGIRRREIEEEEEEGGGEEEGWRRDAEEDIMRREGVRRSGSKNGFGDGDGDGDGDGSDTSSSDLSVISLDNLPSDVSIEDLASDDDYVESIRRKQEEKGEVSRDFSSRRPP